MRGEIELAKERVLEAQGQLESYLKSGMLDIEQHQQLADAFRVAIDEFIEKLRGAGTLPLIYASSCDPRGMTRRTQA
jgi:hypothetical protein